MQLLHWLKWRRFFIFQLKETVSGDFRHFFKIKNLYLCDSEQATTILKTFSFFANIFAKFAGWKGRAGNSLIRSFAQIALIKWATVSDSLRSLRTNEQLWANRSGSSCQKSYHEQNPQVAHDKWVTVSESLRSHMINERMSDSLKIFD